MSQIDKILYDLAKQGQDNNKSLVRQTEDEEAGIFTAIQTVSGVYVATEYDGTLFADASGGAMSVTLPTAVGIGGRVYVVCDNGSATGVNTVTVGTTGGQTISGAATYVITAAYKSVMMQSDGANWFIIAVY